MGQDCEKSGGQEDGVDSVVADHVVVICGMGCDDAGPVQFADEADWQSRHIPVDMHGRHRSHWFGMLLVGIHGPTIALHRLGDKEAAPWMGRTPRIHRIDRMGHRVHCGYGVRIGRIS